MKPHVIFLYSYICTLCSDGTSWSCFQAVRMFHPDPARKPSANLYDIYHCCVYSGKLLMMDRGTVRNMYSFITRINLRNWCIWLVLLLENVGTDSYCISTLCSTRHCSSPQLLNGNLRQMENVRDSLYETLSCVRNKANVASGTPVVVCLYISNNSR